MLRLTLRARSTAGAAAPPSPAPLSPGDGSMSPPLLSPMPPPPAPPSFLQRQLMLTRVTQAQSIVLERHARSAAAAAAGAPGAAATAASAGAAAAAPYHEAASTAMLHAMLHASHAEARIREEGSWRLRMGHAIEGHHVQLVALLLVIVDVVCAVAEIMLASVAGCELEAKPGVVVPDGVKAVPAHRVHTWETALHWISISIVCVLLLQQAVLLVAYGRAWTARQRRARHHRANPRLARCARRTRPSG
jgi:hypothetical protein